MMPHESSMRMEQQKHRKLEITFAPRCHWIHRNLPVRRTDMNSQLGLSHK